MNPPFKTSVFRTLPGRPFQDAMLENSTPPPSLVQILPERARPASKCRAPNCRKIDIAGLSRKNQGHHLESSNMELLIEIPLEITLPLCNTHWNGNCIPPKRSFPETWGHFPLAKFQQLKGQANPFKTTRTEAISPLPNCQQHLRHCYFQHSDLQAENLKFEVDSHGVRRQTVLRVSAWMSKIVSMVEDVTRWMWKSRAQRELRIFLNAFLIPFFLSRCTKEPLPCHVQQTSTNGLLRRGIAAMF